MKKVLVFCLTIALCLTNAFISNSNCNPEEVISMCPSNIPSGFTFVKSYELKSTSGANKRIEKSYVFSKDMTYSLALCKGKSDVRVKIFDSNRKEVASNSYDDKVLTTFGFKCGSTGIYYMAFSLEEKDQDCSAAVLAFKK